MNATCDGNHGGPPCSDPACWNPYPLQLPPISTFRVVVHAPGWHGQFSLPQTYFDELTDYLSERVMP